MANSSAVTIDLSNYSFTGQPAPASYSFSGSPALPGLDELTDDELADLLDAMNETGAFDGYGDDGGELSDDELAELMAAAEAGDTGPDAFSEFDSAFTRHAQAEQEREDARAAAIVEDVLHPARREEDKIARIMARAGQGLYDGQQADFAAESAAIELAAATGRGNCGPADDYGRCSARYHDLECSASLGTDWLFSSPPAAAYETVLANYDDGLALAGIGPAAVYGDPDGDEPSYAVPQETIELAHELVHDWGLDATSPGIPDAAAYLDLLRAPAAPVTVAGEMYGAMGYPSPPEPEPRPSYPGIAELRAQMGI
jgi:hypothetical protein